MDEQRFLYACELQNKGKLREAIDEFLKLARDTDDQIDRAGILLNAATTLRALGEYDRARSELAEARTIAPSLESFHSASLRDERIPQIHLSLDLEEAEIFRYAGDNQQALSRFDHVMVKYQQWWKQPDYRDSYEMTQTRRAFFLADIGRWQLALPILEEAQSFKEHKEGIAFYLGHCYVCAQEYAKAKPKLTEALKSGLPRHLEYRAHNALGIAYFALGGYAQAKSEFEKTATTADPEYLRDGQVWKRLEVSCRELGLDSEADSYARLAKSPGRPRT